MSMATGMGIFFFIFAFLLYKNGLIEAYREIEKMKHQDSQE